ncbi:MAG TPA: hydroxymethylglutaryl-CoA lyase [Bacteroidia bacterium]|nr:hydroxymethylglutaryl-CoA lyase [Bacteroidia bacterium]
MSTGIFVSMNNKVKIIECPRDALQGYDRIVSTADKADYINLLIKCGFDTIDFGSFVSAKAIPQMKDTAEVLKRLNLENSTSKLLAIVANMRGAEDACEFDEISYLGFPYSVSETFQQRNTNKSCKEALILIEHLQSLCVRNHKELVVYISMAFGNPYGDIWNTDIVLNTADQLTKMGIRIISLADTVGSADQGSIQTLFSTLIPAFPDTEFGAHFHSHPSNWKLKLEASFHSGCRRYDGAIKGFGGCPMANDELVGNMDTINLLDFFKDHNQITGVNTESFMNAVKKASEIFI